MTQVKTTDPSVKDGHFGNKQYEPACRLVSLFTVSGTIESTYDIAMKLGRKAASFGETVLILDAVGGDMIQREGIIYARTLDDVAAGRADLKDALYVTSNEHFTAGTVSQAGLNQTLGLLAALSLSYDWVFVVPKEGCQQEHVKLGNASDISLLSYSTQGDNFMRAYWMIEALRRRTPQFDPLLLSTDEKSDAVETAFMLSETIREHLGAPPPYAGHEDDLHLDARLLEQMRQQLAQKAVA